MPNITLTVGSHGIAHEADPRNLTSKDRPVITLGEYMNDNENESVINSSEVIKSL